MKKDIAEKWVADLRDNPPQVKGALYTENGFCCLGRLCMVLGLEPSDVGDGIYAFDDETDMLPSIATSLAGLATDDASFDVHEGPFADFGSLAEANDGGKSFAEIADFIEQYWAEL